MSVTGGGNYFKRGRYVLVSCFHYMGFEDVMSFGDERLNDGAPLPGHT